MKVLIPVKHCLDYHVKARVKPDESGVDLHNAKLAINPFDEIAAEAAIQLQEQQIVSETIAITIGSATAADSLRHALAMGVDRAIHVQSDEPWEPINIALILQAIVQKEQPDVVLMGKQAIDDDCNQTGQMLAALLDWPQACFASAIRYDNQQWQVEREIDGGLETLAFSGPGVITADLRLNQPRFISLPNIMKAKAKPIDTLALADLGLQLTPRQTVQKVTAPAKRGPAQMLDSMDALVQLLKDKEVLV